MRPAPATTAADVQLCWSPWISGTRVVRFSDNVIDETIEMHDAHDFVRLVESLIARVQQIAFSENCNWIIGLELQIDKDRQPSLVRIIGKAAQLEPLF